MNYDNQTLKILQYNMQKSREVMSDAFHHHEIHNYDVLVIQEPYRNHYQNTTHHPAKDRFHLLYFNSKNTRTCFFINRRIDPSAWNIRYINDDICILQLYTPDRRSLRIYNIYNELKAERITRTLEILREELSREDPNNNILLLGDFNLHHPQWSQRRIRGISREARSLINITETSHLWQITPRGMKTHRGTGSDTTIDLAFTTQVLRDQLIHCKIDHSMDCDSDHLPIDIQFNWVWNKVTPRQTRRWAATDMDTLQNRIKERVAELQQADVSTPDNLDKLTEQFVHTLQDAISASTPWNNPSPRSIPGFDKYCKQACSQTQQLRRKWQLSRLEEDWQEYKKARNQKGRLISKHLQQTHRSRVEEAATTEGGLWKITKWALNRQTIPSATITPPLMRPDASLETTPKGKANLLRNTFFPPPVHADLSDISSHSYPPPYYCPPITASEIESAVRKAAPNKAPGPDGIINNILQKTLDLILPILHLMFNASWSLGYFPQHFRQSTTIVLRKPGKDDYTQPKSYRPIALLNTTGKALESVIGTRLMYLADKYDLLPETHIGGRKMMSTEHAVHLILERIHTAWKQKKVASLLLLDVSGAFDNVSHPRLLHNLRKRRIDPTTVQWIKSFLENRTTTLALPEFTAEATEIRTGIPQGSPLSPILYLFYNSDLLEDCANDRVSTTGYIDDVSLLAVGPTVQHNTQALKAAHLKAEQWAQKHGSVFATAKYTLVHLTRKRKVNTKHPLRLPGITITPTSLCRYLGIQISSRLDWREHLQQVYQKATKKLAALASLASSTWGANRNTLRRIYLAMILPQMLYGCSVWYKSKTHRTSGRPHKSQTRSAHTLTPIQRRAAQIITGAFRTTAANAVEVEAYLLPIDQQLEKSTLHSTLRIMSTPLHDLMESTRGDTKGSPLQYHAAILQKHYQINAAHLERRHPHIITPWWKRPLVIVDNTTEAAISHHQDIAASSALCVYTDGSGIDGHVGAAAVTLSMPCSPSSPVLQRRTFYMGRETESTVYAAELKGIALALQILETTPRPERQRVAIFTDNQSALRTIRNPGNTSGQYILLELLRLLQESVALGFETEFRWIPSHQGIPGNEAADQAAKEAAGWTPHSGWTPRERSQELQNQEPTEGIQILLTPAKGKIHEAVYREWETIWDHGRSGRYLHSLGAKPDKKALQLHRDLPRAISSVMTQMRTGKIGLNAYLHSIDKADTGQCTCNQGEQTVEHILLRCREWTAERQELWAGRRPILNLKRLLNTHKLAIRAAQMMLRTGLLKQFQAVATTPPIATESETVLATQLGAHSRPLTTV